MDDHLVICRQPPVPQVLVPPLLEKGQKALESFLTEQDPGVAADNGRLDGELNAHLGNVHLAIVEVGDMKWAYYLIPHLTLL